MIANNIDHLIEILEEIIEQEKIAQSPLGYFPALYRKVTIEVRDKIRSNHFDDGERMERLDVEFANRYLIAYAAHKSNTPLTKSWRLAFDAGEDSAPVVLQHLLLGMNAHINLDLGIVAAEISPGDEIKSLKDDFNKINDILAALVEEVQEKIGEMWVLMQLIDLLGRTLDEALAGFSMNVARAGAWRVAKRMAKISDKDERLAYVNKLDKRVYIFGCKLYKPGFIIRCLIRLTKWTEKGTVAERIETLLI